MKKQLLSLAAGSALLLAASSSFAVSPIAAGSLSYDITLSDSCTAAVTGQSFGTWPALRASAVPAGQAAGKITVTCPLAYKVCVAKGTGAVAGERGLVGPSTLKYVLKSGGTEVGDNGCKALGVVAADTATWAAYITAPSGVATPTDYTLTADITTLATSAAGTYSDTVPVNVVY